MLDHKGTSEKDMYFRKNVTDYPDYFHPTSSSQRSRQRPGTSLTMQSSSAKFIKTNASYRRKL